MKPSDVAIAQNADLLLGKPRNPCQEELNAALADLGARASNSERIVK